MFSIFSGATYSPWKRKTDSCRIYFLSSSLIVIVGAQFSKLNNVSHFWHHARPSWHSANVVLNATFFIVHCFSYNILIWQLTCANLKMCLLRSMIRNAPFCKREKRCKYLQNIQKEWVRLDKLTSRNSPTSPVWSQPSWSIVSAVFSGSFKYPINTLGPLMQTSPFAVLGEVTLLRYVH